MFRSILSLENHPRFPLIIGALLLLPIITTVFFLFFGFFFLLQTKDAIETGNFLKANKQAYFSFTNFSIANYSSNILVLESYGASLQDIISPLKRVSHAGQSLSRGAQEIASASNNLRNVFSGDSLLPEIDFSMGIHQLQAAIRDLQNVCAQPDIVREFHLEKTKKLLTDFKQVIPVLSLAPRLVGMDKEKKYLILFQNNAELRPGGGFIGSYGLVTFHKGKMGPLTVHNTYDADGQLKIHVEPYYIGRRYIQVHLYMRDSNFDVDFLKSAQKVAYMFEAETGEHPDGVIAIDLSFVKSLVEVIAPVRVWQYDTIVNLNNFFIVTETRADRYSFFGSSQKQDFLGALFYDMQNKIETNKSLYANLLLQKIADAIKQKHMLFALLNPTLQTVLTQNKLSSTLPDNPKQEPGSVADFLGINEANISINKANYFTYRGITHHMTIDTSGSVSGVVTLTYTNTTKPHQWPSNYYRPYIRIILPLHAQLLGIAVDKKEQKIVPAVTDFYQYEAPGFHPPDGLEVDKTEEEGKTIYGFVILVPVQSTKTVAVSYRLADKLDINNPLVKYNLYVFKQPGMDNDFYYFSLSYPPFYKAAISPPLKSSDTRHGDISFLTRLSTDQEIKISMRRQ